MSFTLVLAGLSSFAQDVNFGKPAVIPAPVEMTYASNVVVRLDKDCVFAVTCPDAAAEAWVADHAERCFGVRPRVTFEKTEAKGVTSSEGYVLSAKPGRVTFAAPSLAGVRYAFATLRQVAQCVPKGLTAGGYWLPALEVRDAPKLAFRGMHLCWMPETSPVLIERLVRLAAYYKMNAVVIESWGTFRSEKHPWWGWRDGKMTKAEVRRLRAIADDLGVTLVPQLNVFGHASMSRVLSGKHAAIDLSPEYQPLFEPDGWNWCLSNPDALKVIGELVAEMHEAFGNPPYFHIGCDEAHAPGCACCRAVQPYASLVERHIVAIHDLLKSRGARAMMWHDMLLERGNPRWKPFYANGSKEEAEMADRLPRDIVICDWYYGHNYGKPTDPKGYPSLDYFAGLGFPTLTCPWNDPAATALQGAYAAKHGLFGMLGTTWHHGYKSSLPCDILAPTASAAWGTPADTTGFGIHWRQMGWDAKIRDYDDCGFVTEQLPSKTNIEIRPGS